MPEVYMLVLIKGIVIGFITAAPVGPVGFLCAERTINKGKAAGIVSGLGAAMGDIFYGAVAAFGFVGIASAILEYKTSLRAAGAVFLIVMGIIYLVKKAGVVEKHVDKEHAIAETFFSSLFLALTNPLTIISFGTLFAGASFESKGALRHVGHHDVMYAAVLTVGVAIGAIVCWLALVLAVSWFHKRKGYFSMKIVSRAAGIVFLVFGAAMLWSL
jgi:threonine/homoserine/homoserine lactone efflux protein